jgi:ectoine hydroxylase-related dioxygenase (phytanoyl-CoA dioxygenase family)
MTLSFRSDPEAALERYREDGYFIEEAVLRPEECDELIKAGMGLPGAKFGDYKPAMQPHRQNPAFLKALRHTGVVSTIARLVGGKPVGLQTEFFYGKPGVKGFANHQDNFFVEAHPDAFASAWIPLADVGPENGGLIGYPGSHKEGRLPVRKIEAGKVAEQDPNANNEESILPPDYSPIDLYAKKGSVVFLHSHFVHGSRPNRTQNYRYVLLCTYLREGTPFRSGRYAQREPIALGL